MSTDQFWVNLPLEAQIILASGYVAYSLGYLGTKRNHKASDVVLRTLAFSLVATLGMYIANSICPQFWIGGVSAFVISVVTGCAWRGFGNNWVLWAMRASNISWSSDDYEAIAGVLKDSKSRVSQISVKLHDGSWLSCNNTTEFADAPFWTVHYRYRWLSRYISHPHHRCRGGEKRDENDY